MLTADPQIATACVEEDADVEVPVERDRVAIGQDCEAIDQDCEAIVADLAVHQAANMAIPTAMNVM